MLAQELRSYFFIAFLLLLIHILLLQVLFFQASETVLSQELHIAKAFNLVTKIHMTSLLIYDTDTHTNGGFFVFPLFTLPHFISHILIIILFHKGTRLIVRCQYRWFSFFGLAPKLQIRWSYHWPIVDSPHLLLIVIIRTLFSLQMPRYITLNVFWIGIFPYLRLVKELRIRELLLFLLAFYATLHLLCSVPILRLIDHSVRFPYRGLWLLSDLLLNGGVSLFQSIGLPRGCHIYYINLYYKFFNLFILI